MIFTRFPVSPFSWSYQKEALFFCAFRWWRSATPATVREVQNGESAQLPYGPPGQNAVSATIRAVNVTVNYPPEVIKHPGRLAVNWARLQKTALSRNL